MWPVSRRPELFLLNTSSMCVVGYHVILCCPAFHKTDTFMWCTEIGLVLNCIYAAFEPIPALLVCLRLLWKERMQHFRLVLSEQPSVYRLWSNGISSTTGVTISNDAPILSSGINRLLYWLAFRGRKEVKLKKGGFMVLFPLLPVFISPLLHLF